VCVGGGNLREEGRGSGNCAAGGGRFGMLRAVAAAAAAVAGCWGGGCVFEGGS